MATAKGKGRKKPATATGGGEETGAAGGTGTGAKAGAKAGPKAGQKTGGKTVAKAAAKAGVPMPRLQARYRDEIRAQLKSELGLDNVMEVPRLQKIVVNVGMGEAVANAKLLETAAEEIAAITGQKPIITRARKAIATFRLRQGMAIGCKVTLRNRRMYEFMDRLISLGLPRIRDFRGVSPKSFDGRGNYSLGVKEQLIFPEIDYEKTAGIHGMDISFITTARTDDEGRALMKALGMPFRAK
jgi:large subunit ribosomal protein L5